MSDLVAAAAFVTSLVALLIASKQLRVAHEPLARGLIIGASSKTGVITVNHVEQPREFEFSIMAAGPGTYFDVVGIVIDGADERHTVIDSVPRLTNELGKVTGSMSMTTDEARSGMFVVIWVSGHRGGRIRTNAFRIPILDAPIGQGTGSDAGAAPSRATRAGRPDSVQGPFADEPAVRTLEVFRWDWTSQMRNRLLIRAQPHLPGWVRHVWSCVPSRFRSRVGERFQRSGRWRPVPPTVPVRGILPGLRDRGRWH